MKPITLEEFNAYAKTCSEMKPNLWQFLTQLSFDKHKRVVYQNNTLIVNVKIEFIRNGRQSEDLLCKELIFKDMHFMQDVSIDKIDDLVLHIDNNVVFKKFLIKSIDEEEIKGSINNVWIHKDFKCEECIIMNYRIVSFCVFAHNMYGNFTFNECEFENFFYYQAEFHKFNFYGKILFRACIFKNDMTFINSIFHNQVDFKKSKFCDNPHFNNAIFKESADFHECVFEKVACFYGVTFEKVPNFSQATFEGSVNLVNAKLEFDFENVETNIKETHKAYHQERQENKPLAYFANDFRDSFRLFKNALIKDNNLLEASQWHKLELYCKEIELDSKKSKIFSKEWIDKWVLRFYRATSEHHTDLLKILNNVLMLIALFGLFSFGMFCFAQKGDIGYAQDTQAVWYILGKIPPSSHFWVDWDYEVFLELIVISAICFAFVVIFFILFYLRQYEWFKAIMALCFIGDILILAIKPALLLPIFGKFLDESLKVNFPAFTSLSAIYAILMFLLIFSLQKTARKNSIIPH